MLLPAAITSLTTYLVDEGTAVAFLVLQAGCMVSTGVLLPKAGLVTSVSHPDLVADGLKEGGGRQGGTGLQHKVREWH